jgi:hypothetical protein
MAVQAGAGVTRLAYDPSADDEAALVAPPLSSGRRRATSWTTKSQNARTRTVRLRSACITR